MKKLTSVEIKSIIQGHWTKFNPNCLPSSSLTNILENALLTTKQVLATIHMHLNNNIEGRIKARKWSTLIITGTGVCVSPQSQENLYFMLLDWVSYINEMATMASHSQSGKFTAWLLSCFSHLGDHTAHAQPLLLLLPPPAQRRWNPQKWSQRLISWLEWLLSLSSIPNCSARLRPDGWGMGKED